MFAAIATLAALAVGVGAADSDSPGSEDAGLRGAQLHPLWADSSPAQYERELDLLRAAGANAVRFDLVWASLEPHEDGERASPYAEAADEFLAAAAARGLDVIATLHATPCWASSAPPAKKRGCKGAYWKRGVTAYPPKRARDYAEIAAWVADRWGDELAALEVWNEPNEPRGDFLRSPKQARDYARLLRAAYPAVKSVRPSLPVLGGAIAFSDGRFVERLYRRGIKGRFDALSFHPYSESRPPSAAAAGVFRKWSFISGIQWIREIMLAHRDPKPLWLTEFGWSTCVPTTAYGRKTCVSEELQAAYTDEAWGLIGSLPYVAAATQYSLRDTGGSEASVNGRFGLVHRDFVAKPAYAAFRAALSR